MQQGHDQGRAPAGRPSRLRLVLGAAGALALALALVLLRPDDSSPGLLGDGEPAPGTAQLPSARTSSLPRVTPAPGLGSANDPGGPATTVPPAPGSATPAPAPVTPTTPPLPAPTPGSTAPGEDVTQVPAAPEVADEAAVRRLAPTFTRTRTWFGTALSSGDGNINQALARNDRLFTRLPVVRQFDPQVPPVGAWARRTALHDRVVSTSFREPPAEILAGKHDRRILQYFQEAPTAQPIFWTYFHEPEPHVVRGEFTPEQYRAAWRHVVRLAAKAERSNLYPTLVLTGWTADPRSKRNWRDYYPGDDFISVLAWDPYNSATRRPTEYADPERLYRHVRDHSVAAGKPWAIAETGSMLVSGDDGSRRAAWLRRVGRWFEANGAVFVTYFQSTRDGNFKLDDDHSVKAWRDAVWRSAR